MTPRPASSRSSDAAKVNFEKTKSFKLAFTVTDNGTPKPITSKATVVISLNDKNEAPVFDAKQASTFTIAEANKADAKVGGIKAKDADKNGETVSYAFLIGSVLSQSFGPFRIDAASGVITVPTAGALDFETTTSYSVTVRATDSNATDSKFRDLPLTINVSDVNEAPRIVFNNTASTPAPVTVLSLSLASISSSQKIGTFVVTDVDAGPAGANTRAFVDGSKGGFVFNTTTGEVTIGDKTKLAVGKSYKITLSTIDGASKPIKGKLDVTITITA